MGVIITLNLIFNSVARFSHPDVMSLAMHEACTHMQRTMAAISEDCIFERVIVSFAIWKGTGNTLLINWKVLDCCHRLLHT